MSRIPIILFTISGYTATSIDVRIVSIPLYPNSGTDTNIFYGFYTGNSRIDGAEGNHNSLILINKSNRDLLLNALTASVGAVQSASLMTNQLYNNNYVLKYKQGGVDRTVTITGSFFSSYYDLIRNEILSLLSVTPAKQLIVNSISVQNDYAATVTLHNTTGTDTATDLYFGAVRADLGDTRVIFNEVHIPFAILKKDSSSILISFTANLVAGNNYFGITSSPNITYTPYKIACLTDTHYDPNDTAEDRNQTLNFIDNFVTRMGTYLPDLAVNNGDKIGESNNNISNEITRLAWYQSNLDHFAAVSAHATAVRDGVAMGNHDNEAFNWTNVLAKHSGETWMQSGVMYGYWESADFRFISLDGNYNSSTQAHNNNFNTIYGYVDNTQMAWFTATLASSTKPCIVFIHHACCEIDTAIILLTKEIYHLSNRVALRSVMEASGKVACVIHGHLHWHRHDVINGIPYLVMTNSATEAQPLSNPTNTSGRWYLIEIDREACTIKFTLEGKIGSNYYTIYEDIVAYKTIFDSDIAQSAERVFALNYGATYAKASLLTDPAQIYSVNKDYIATMPVNKYLGEPYISDRTIKIVGRTDSPNIGKGAFYFATQTGLFRMRFGLYAAQLKTLNFKIGNGSNADTAPSIIFNLVTDGAIVSSNGASGSTIASYATTVWYQFEIIANTSASTFTIKKDAAAIATSFSFKGTNSQLNQLQIETETGSWFIDNLRVEHYTVPEPVNLLS